LRLYVTISPGAYWLAYGIKPSPWGCKMGNDEEPGKNNREKLEAHLREARTKAFPDLLDSVTIGREELKLLAARVEGLEARLKTKKLKETQEKIWYFAPLILVVVFTWLLVQHGWAEKPDVSIEFNVGEIVGGSLVGVGALIAGVAYAFGRRRGES
jgi:hypothetical protein